MSFFNAARTNRGVIKDIEPVLSVMKPGEKIEVGALSALLETRRRSVSNKTIGRLLMQNENFESLGHGVWRKR